MEYTAKRYHDARARLHEFIGRCSVKGKDTMSTVPGYQQFSIVDGYSGACGEYHRLIGRCSVQWRDIMSTVQGYHDTCGEHHEYMGRC